MSLKRVLSLGSRKKSYVWSEEELATLNKAAEEESGYFRVLQREIAQAEKDTSLTLANGINEVFQSFMKEKRNREWLQGGYSLLIQPDQFVKPAQPDLKNPSHRTVKEDSIAFFIAKDILVEVTFNELFRNLDAQNVHFVSVTENLYQFLGYGRREDVINNKMKALNEEKGKITSELDAKLKELETIKKQEEENVKKDAEKKAEDVKALNEGITQRKDAFNQRKEALRKEILKIKDKLYQIDNQLLYLKQDVDALKKEAGPVIERYKHEEAVKKNTKLENIKRLVKKIVAKTATAKEYKEELSKEVEEFINILGEIYNINKFKGSESHNLEIFAREIRKLVKPEHPLLADPKELAEYLIQKIGWETQPTKQVAVEPSVDNASDMKASKDKAQPIQAQQGESYPFPFIASQSRYCSILNHNRNEILTYAIDLELKQLDIGYKAKNAKSLFDQYQLALDVDKKKGSKSTEPVVMVDKETKTKPTAAFNEQKSSSPSTADKLLTDVAENLYQRMPVMQFISQDKSNHIKLQIKKYLQEKLTHPKKYELHPNLRNRNEMFLHPYVNEINIAHFAMLVPMPDHTIVEEVRRPSVARKTSLSKKEVNFGVDDVKASIPQEAQAYIDGVKVGCALEPFDAEKNKDLSYGLGKMEAENEDGPYKKLVKDLSDKQTSAEDIKNQLEKRALIEWKRNRFANSKSKSRASLSSPSKSKSFRSGSETKQTTHTTPADPVEMAKRRKTILHLGPAQTDDFKTAPPTPITPSFGSNTQPSQLNAQAQSSDDLKLPPSSAQQPTVVVETKLTPPPNQQSPGHGGNTSFSEKKKPHGRSGSVIFPAKQDELGMGIEPRYHNNPTLGLVFHHQRDLSKIPEGKETELDRSARREGSAGKKEPGHNSEEGQIAPRRNSTSK